MSTYIILCRISPEAFSDVKEFTKDNVKVKNPHNRRQFLEIVKIRYKVDTDRNPPTKFRDWEEVE